MRSKTRGSTYKYRCEKEIPQLESKISYLEDMLMVMRKQIRDNNQVDPILFDQIMIQWSDYKDALTNIKLTQNPATQGWVIANEVLSRYK